MQALSLKECSVLLQWVQVEVGPQSDISIPDHCCFQSFMTCAMRFCLREKLPRWIRRAKRKDYSPEWCSCFWKACRMGLLKSNGKWSKIDKARLFSLETLCIIITFALKCPQEAYSHCLTSERLALSYTYIVLLDWSGFKYKKLIIAIIYKGMAVHGKYWTL